ncbi:MAG: class I SAM-dependent methyltransferase [Phycisphaerales bacterium]|nr:MAG: class I SAM-dependent methyltransferase [Phycisphaerales bacterium]
MHTKINKDNPHGHDRWGFAWEHVPAEGAAHLDFGCNDGKFLDTLRHKRIGRLVGADVSGSAIERGRRAFPDLELVRISDAGALPFADRAFESMTILDVLEHVYEQRELLGELNRVLNDGGRLVVTVPGRHLFSFLDMGNFKFRFPRLHRWHYCRRHSRQEYEDRYVANPEGLVGDISAKKLWHEHFSRHKLGGLLTEAGFKVIDFDGSGFFWRVTFFAGYPFRGIGVIRRALSTLENLDAKLFESANLFCVAAKQEHISRKHQSGG